MADNDHLVMRGISSEYTRQNSKLVWEEGRPLRGACENIGVLGGGSHAEVVEEGGFLLPQPDYKL